VDQNSARVPRYPFEPLFSATATMNPSFRFDTVDVVTNRNSLRKLLDFCTGRIGQDFRVNLLLVKNTLFIERCEKSLRELAIGSQNSGWGHSFEESFTEYPPGLRNSAGHHRALVYHLGNLRCAVRFEVDACYRSPSSGNINVDSLITRMDRLTIGSIPTRKTTNITLDTAPMLQSAAAEMKAATKAKSIGVYMPQLWFGRTPWLITGQHSKGTFNELKIVKTDDKFESWETKKQLELRKMVSVLSQFRNAVKLNEGKKCVALCERSSNPLVIKIFSAKADSEALPKELVNKFWKKTD